MRNCSSKVPYNLCRNQKCNTDNVILINETEVKVFTDTTGVSDSYTTGPAHGTLGGILSNIWVVSYCLYET